MGANHKYKILPLIIGAIAFSLLGACDSDKGESAVKNMTENVSKELENKVGEVAVTAAEKTEEVIAEVKEKTSEVVEKVEEKPAESSTVEVEKVKADTSTGGAEYIVKMLNTGKGGEMMTFEPAFLKVEKGATVKFVPTDVAHDSVSVYVPEGASGWIGENSKEVTVTLDVEGVYIYKCTPHSMMGMVGVIQVGNAANKAEAEKAAEGLVASMAMGKERLGKYLTEVK